jgi:hypothetical protein
MEHKIESWNDASNEEESIFDDPKRMKQVRKVVNQKLAEDQMPPQVKEYDVC